MLSIRRRNFIGTAGAGAMAVSASPFITKSWAKRKPGDTIRIAIMGLRSRGKSHANAFAGMKNVEVAVLCDPDTRLFKPLQDNLEEKTGKRPKTETDIRRVIEDKKIDAISIAAPNYWHAPATIWACQAGKDVYVEKPASHTVWEGRKMVEAARKYNCIVQTGSQGRSDPLKKSAVEFIQSGKLGKIYMAKAVIYKERPSFGLSKTGPVPEGVDYNLWLGPIPWRPYDEHRFHYNWHWFWDSGNGETGNNGPHYTDMIRWALGKYEHPRIIRSMGGVLRP